MVFIHNATRVQLSSKCSLHPSVYALVVVCLLAVAAGYVEERLKMCVTFRTTLMHLLVASFRYLISIAVHPTNHLNVTQKCNLQSTSRYQVKRMKLNGMQNLFCNVITFSIENSRKRQMIFKIRVQKLKLRNHIKRSHKAGGGPKQWPYMTVLWLTVEKVNISHWLLEIRYYHKEISYFWSYFLD